MLKGSGEWEQQEQGQAAVCAKVNSIEFLQFLMPAAHITTPATPSPTHAEQQFARAERQGKVRGGSSGRNLRHPHRKTRRIFFIPPAVGSWQRACDLLGIDILMMCLGALSPAPLRLRLPLCQTANAVLYFCHLPGAAVDEQGKEQEKDENVAVARHSKTFHWPSP